MMKLRKQGDRLMFKALLISVISTAVIYLKYKV